MPAISNLGTLTNAITDYLARDDLTQFVPNFIQNAENKIYRKYNIRDMETALSGTVSSGTLAVPTRYNGLKYMYVNQSPVIPLKRVSPDFLYEKYPNRADSGNPLYVAVENGEFIFGPYPADVSIVGVYYERYEPLRDSDSNWYVVNAPEVLLYASLLEAEAFIMNDPRIMLWRAALDDAINTIVMSEREEKYSGSAPYAVAL